MSLNDRQTALSLYCTLMGEIKRRLAAIPALLAIADSDNIRSVVSGESCYLQLRITGELIALSCLVAHNDISAPLRWLSSPGDILKRLEALHGDFYPCPVKFLDVEGKPVDIRTTEQAGAKYQAPGPYLTKRDLLDLDGLCGDIIHKGSLRSLLAKPKLIYLDNINDWTSKITNLLSEHEIQLIDPNWVIWTSLGEADQPARAFLMSRQPSPNR